MLTALQTQGEGGMLYNHTHLMGPIVITLSSLQRQVCGKRSAAVDQRGGQSFFAYVWNNVEKYMKRQSDPYGYGKAMKT